MLVHRDQPPERKRRELVEEDRRRGPVPLEPPVRLGRVGQAVHQGLGLREEVRQQHVVMLVHRVVAANGGDEVAGDQPRSLVDQLIERVLAVGSRLAPDDGAGAVVDALAGAVHALAVRLHVALLEVRREAVEVLVVGQDGVRLRAEEVAVPDAQ